VLEALVEADGAIPVVRVTDTVKRIADGGVETLPRDGLVLVQTPQAFRRAALEQAHRRAAREGYASTDDAALLERDGARIATVAGDPANIKVTTREDLRLAETLASALLR
jgi:2-C-methyl-D-erythritol 4-phosphate cytidylyltransferase